jgi:hypothetical protein
MNQPPNDTRARYRLDGLLKRLPPTGGEPTDAEWQSRLERTLRRVRDLSPSASGGSEGAVAETAINDDQVLRTPLPVEAGEPEPVDPYGFVADQAAAYDELRAPLQSGEHPPLRLAAPVDDQRVIASDTRSEGDLIRVPNRVYWTAGGLGTLAAAAAIVIFLGKRAPVEITTPAADLQVNRVEQNHASAPAESAVRGEHPIVTASPQPKAAELALEAKSASPTGQNMATRTAANHERPKLNPAPTELGTVPASNEPELVPAAGPASLIDHPSTGAVNAALARRLQEAQRCLSPRVPTTGVRLTFRSLGTVQSVEILNSAADSTTRACVQEALESAKVEPFARTQYDVTTTISLPPAAAKPSGK